MAREKLLAAAPDVLRAKPIAAIGDEGTGSDDVAPSYLAVEAKPHQAARTQEACEHAPALHGIGEVVQRATRFHDVETQRFAGKLEDIALRIVDVI